MIYNPESTGKAQKYFDKLVAKKCRFELREIKENRSNPQNRYFHLLCKYFSQETGFEIPEVKSLIKRTVCPDIFTISKSLYNGNQGSTFLFERSTASLDSAEMTKVIDRFRRWASEDAGIYLPMSDGMPDTVTMDAMENEMTYD